MHVSLLMTPAGLCGVFLAELLRRPVDGLQEGFAVATPHITSTGSLLAEHYGRGVT